MVGKIHAGSVDKGKVIQTVGSLYIFGGIANIQMVIGGCSPETVKYQVTGTFLQMGISGEGICAVAVVHNIGNHATLDIGGECTCNAIDAAIEPEFQVLNTAAQNIHAEICPVTGVVQYDLIDIHIVVYIGCCNALGRIYRAVNKADSSAVEFAACI